MTSKKQVRAAADWLEGKPPPPRGRSGAEKISAREREVLRLETRIWAKLEAITLLFGELRSARRSLRALERAERKRRGGFEP